jgi:hypothetical protein
LEPHNDPEVTNCEETSSASTNLSIGRRGFLKLGAGAVAAAGAYGLLGASPASAQQPESVKVLIEELRLNAQELARGNLQGLDATARGIAAAAGRGAHGVYVSPVLTAKGVFTHIGLHWTADAPDLAFEVRWANNGGGWSEWQPVLVEPHGPAIATGETFGALVSVGQATRLQFRGSFSGGTQTTLSETTATLLNSPAVETTTTSTAAASVPTLTNGAVFSRADWGCNESIGFSNGQIIWPPTYVPPKKVVVHHTATSNSYSTVDGAKAEVRAVHVYHARTLGWGDIGYNALIDKFGNVYEGRRGRTGEMFSPYVVAGHASAHNYGSTGVSLLGTFTKSGEAAGTVPPAPSTAMRNSLTDVVAWECGRNDINPETASDYLLINDNWNRGLRNVSGHRDCNSTICPGGQVYDLLPSLRTAVASKLQRGAPLAQLTPPSVDTVQAGSAGALQFTWGGGSSQMYLLEGWKRQTPTSENLYYLSGFDGAQYATWKTAEGSSATLAQLLLAFGGSNPPVPGHYTFHVVAKDSGGKLSYQRDHTLLVTDGGGGSSNQPPAVTITSPATSASFPQGSMVSFSGSASDPEDGNLTSSLAWTSSKDGAIGTGGTFSKSNLSVGEHVVTASVKDKNGAEGSASVTITVSAQTTTSFTLSARAYKVQGLQKVDLKWYGATSGWVAIARRSGSGSWSTINTVKNNAGATAAAPNSYTDNINARGGGSYSYRLTEVSSPATSNEVTVFF